MIFLSPTVVAMIDLTLRFPRTATSAQVLSSMSVLRQQKNPRRISIRGGGAPSPNFISKHLDAIGQSICGNSSSRCEDRSLRCTCVRCNKRANLRYHDIDLGGAGLGRSDSHTSGDLGENPAGPSAARCTKNPVPKPGMRAPRHHRSKILVQARCKPSEETATTDDTISRDKLAACQRGRCT